ncbi:MAG: enterochelin esterase-like enzyme [Neolewinella sp.]|jgi:enterochelin esterase-like enzyme
MYIFRYTRQLLGSIASRKQKLLVRSYLMPSEHLGRDVMVDVYRPALPPWRLMNLAVFNDGQDLERMNLREQLQTAFKEHTLSPTVVIGVHAGDRMREYGTTGRPDYKGRGDQAGAYEYFLIEELIPWIEKFYNVYQLPARRAIAGFSLGGLNAFDVAWRNPGEFGVAGVFSGSLWWRSKAFRKDQPDANLIVHNYVQKTKKMPKVRLWFMAGTADEEADRNNNGIIDAIDDTLQLLQILKEKGQEEEKDFTYVEVKNGRHEPETWGTVVLDFLKWA